ncbi:MAG: hypothetical protein OXU36_07875 [Candidatus Poribacteria bacterium]|nr:hypothetical protein [Candidatus Poribacteria bacterium]
MGRYVDWARVFDINDWIQWNITHASNSGIYNRYEMTWPPIVEEFIDNGVINETILPPNARIPNRLRMDMCGWS